MFRQITATVADVIYCRDFAGRSPVLRTPLKVTKASHLTKTHLTSDATGLISALETAGDVSPYISPMQAAKHAFKKAVKTRDWSKYKKMMDQILNKWGIYHFHLNENKTLAFVYISDETNVAHVLEIMPHGNDWKLEAHLVKLAVENWPDIDMVHVVGQGTTSATEDNLLTARRAGINMAVEVNGHLYVPRGRALMSDGSSSENVLGTAPHIYL